jgi:hypothetical protein
MMVAGEDARPTIIFALWMSKRLMNNRSMPTAYC